MITTKYDVDGKDIYVYDDVFTYFETCEYYNKIINKPYFRQNKDNFNSNLDSIDLKWYHEFNEKDAIETGLINDYINRIDFFKNQEFKIHKHYINCSTFETLDSIHIDGYPLYTLIHYANFEWNLNWFGETIFLNDDLSEIIKSVLLKSGRIIIFDGTIPHSARTPSKNSKYPRYTVVTKFFIKKKNEE